MLLAVQIVNRRSFIPVNMQRLWSENSAGALQSAPPCMHLDCAVLGYSVPGHAVPTTPIEPMTASMNVSRASVRHPPVAVWYPTVSHASVRRIAHMSFRGTGKKPFRFRKTAKQFGMFCTENSVCGFEAPRHLVLAGCGCGGMQGKVAWVVALLDGAGAQKKN